MESHGFRVSTLGAVLFWGLIWELVGHFELLLLFPPLSEVLMALPQVITTPSFAGAAWITVYCYVLGVVLAAVCGVGLGLLMGLVPAADRLLNLWVNIFLSAPLSALVPVFMILFGIGAPTVVVTVFMFAVWIIALDTRAGVLHAPPSLLEMSRSFGASRGQRLKIVLLSALPEILAGIRLGLIRGVKGVVIGQLLVSIIGVGALFALYSQNFLMAHFWALIVILFAMALTLAHLVGRLENRVEYYAGARG